MTRQETLDTVVTHLLTQNATSMRENMCAYRGVDGLKCAVGALIPDELYHLEMEGKHARQRRVASCLVSLGHDVDLCGSLQAIHDCGNVPVWRDELASLACNEGLAFNPPAVTP